MRDYDYYMEQTQGEQPPEYPEDCAPVDPTERGDQ